MAKHAKPVSRIGIAIIAVLLAVALGVGLFFALSYADGSNTADRSSSKTATSSQKQADPITVTIGSTGDILLHSPILNAHKTSDGAYDFSEIFTYATPYFTSYDYMVANLEVTCAGASRAYSGYPCFNAPDNIVSSLKHSGVDMLLTANNHCFDTGTAGFWRTQQTIVSAGLEHTGTFSEGSKPYLVKDIKGIRIGIINYTYETPTTAERKALNGILVSTEAQSYVNSFHYDHLDAFYADLKKNLAAMYADGAEATMVYLHWGDEYQLTPNRYQTSIAQKLCDLGVDVIVGGHPHVVQPIEIFSSEVSGKQTVCLYSMGNAISNQRAANMNLKTGHTEDGMIFETSFTKHSDGSVVLSGIDVVPIWANRFKTQNGRRYHIIPLQKDGQWSEAYHTLGRTGEMERSLQRTTALTEAGLSTFASEYVQRDLRVKQ